MVMAATANDKDDKMKADPIEECIRALQSDRLITLNISDPEASFSVQVQQNVLEAASPWFRKALRDDRFIEGQYGTIAFAHDDTASWKVLLYWLLHHELPEERSGDRAEDEFIDAAKCWILGDKYEVTKFQNKVMLYLLGRTHWSDLSITPMEYKELITATPAESKLMKLLGEEVAIQINEGGISYEEITVLDGTIGFWPHFVEAQHWMKKNEYHYRDRMQGIDFNGSGSAHWRDYMVGEQPKFADCLEDNT